MLGAEIIAKTLHELNIKVVYLYPGGTIAPLLDELVKAGIEYFCARNEQGAGYAAIGAAKITGNPQVVIVTSGPGVTNVLTPVADAYYDSVPILVFTGQVGTNDINFERKIRQTGFQETDAINIFKPVTKKSCILGIDDQISQLIEGAYYLTQDGRPGPVLIDLPMDVQKKEFDYGEKNQVSKSESQKHKSSTETGIYTSIIEKLVIAQRPLILAGNGIHISDATEDFRLFVHNTKIPVVSSLPGLGSIPSDDPWSFSFIGHTGEFYSNLALFYSDFLIVLGSRLDLRQTGSEIASFRKNKFIVRVDIDSNEFEFGRIKADINLNIDIKEFISNFSLLFRTKENNPYSQWIKKLKNWKERFDSSQFYQKNHLSARDIIIRVDQITKDREVVVTTGVGAHQQFVARYFTFDHPQRIWLTSAGHGTMGFDIPANIGAVMASNNKMGIVFVGDGSFQMNIQELATINEFNLPIKIFVLDNLRLGIVSQFQLLNWGCDPSTGNKKNPSFSKIGKAYGLDGYDIFGKSDLKKIPEIFSNETPAVVHCHLPDVEDVLPMLLAGQNLNEMYPFKKEEL